MTCLGIQSTTEGAKIGLFSYLLVTEDVVVDGRTIISKGNMAPMHYVSGSLTQTGYLGTICSPTAGIVMNTEVMYPPKGTFPKVPVPPGLYMANQHQFVPVSFANPRVPGSKDVIEIPTHNCVAYNIPVTVYITGPPSAP